MEDCITETKVCARCKIERPASDFNTKSNGRLRSYCRECTAEYNRAWRESHKGYHYDYNKKWRADNYDKYREYMRDYQREWTRKWRADNPEKAREYARMSDGDRLFYASALADGVDAMRPDAS